MICPDCGVTTLDQYGTLRDGDVSVDTTWTECPKCGEKWFGPQTLRDLEAAEDGMKS